MLVQVVGKVVHGPAVAEVHVLDQSGPLEGLEAPVDGGPVHLSRTCTNAVGQLVSGEVAVYGYKLLDERTAGEGESQAPRAEQGDELIDPCRRHPGLLGRGDGPIGR